MENKSFLTNAIDWYFVRVFIKLEEGEGAIEDGKPYLVKGLKYVGVLFLLVMINGILSWVPDFPYKYYLLFAGTLLWISLLIITGYKFFRTLRKSRLDYEESTNYPQLPTEEIALYITNDEGIYINLFNKKSVDEMVFIRWDLIKSIVVGSTSFSYATNNASRRYREEHVARLFDEAREKLGTFPYEPQERYEDKFAVVLFTKNQLQSQLPLPPCWSQEQVSEFVHEFTTRGIDMYGVDNGHPHVT